MALASGARLGPYEVVAQIGAGGMGEVYRARDTTLIRDVALKVLPEAFAGDPERLARFQREAHVLASLNHPNIAHVYGVEDGALVMEFVDGEDLAERLARDGAIPIDEALPVALQIAEALECAHDLGIVYRDLKPANVKVRPDGTVKVLDFGLAKALEPAAATSVEAMNSPTLTARATEMGVIIGTAAYMSPEQARGRAVDRRADIWAFGAILFEMLTGRRAFDGNDISITLASVLKDDVRWDALPVDLPASVRRVLRRCLEKDPKRRLSAIGDARFDLEDGSRTPEDDRPSARRARWIAGVPWAIAVIALAALAAMSARVWKGGAPRDAVRLTVAAPDDKPLNTRVGPAVVIAPDGRSVVFNVIEGGTSRLYYRRLADTQATPLAGTDNAESPFFSPDGKWVGFFADEHLKKTSTTGGGALVLADVVADRGGAWGDDGTIVFQASNLRGGILQRVSDTGGPMTVLGTLAAEETTQRWPQVLPHRRGILYSSNAVTMAWDAGTIMVRRLDGSDPTVLVRNGYFGRYVPGHILFIRGATLFAVRFDLDSLTVSADPVTLVRAY